MRALVAERGADIVFAAAGLNPASYRSTCAAAAPRDFLGARRFGESFCAGVAAPFGRLGAQNLANLADAAEREGGAQLRLTPWRALLAPVPSHAAAERLAQAAQVMGFIVDAADPRLALAACPGAPECPQGEGATRLGVEALAGLARQLAPDGIGLHVSGCAKGCAKPSPTPLTLVATSEGFNIVYDGLAGDAPSQTAFSFEDVGRLFAAREAKEGLCPAR